MDKEAINLEKTKDKQKEALSKLKQMQAELGFEMVPEKEMVGVKCDVFAPCALGAAINHKTVNQLHCKIVAGSANNQLESPELAEVLKERGILYAPDYVINAGGLINVYQELEGYSRERSERMTRGIYYNLKYVFQLAEKNSITTEKAAELMVEERLTKLRRSNALFQQDRKTVLAHIHNRRRQTS